MVGPRSDLFQNLKHLSQTAFSIENDKLGSLRTYLAKWELLEVLLVRK